MLTQRPNSPDRFCACQRFPFFGGQVLTRRGQILAPFTWMGAPEYRRSRSPTPSCPLGMMHQGRAGARPVRAIHPPRGTCAIAEPVPRVGRRTRRWGTSPPTQAGVPRGVWGEVSHHAPSGGMKGIGEGGRDLTWLPPLHRLPDGARRLGGSYKPRRAVLNGGKRSLLLHTHPSRSTPLKSPLKGFPVPVWTKEYQIPHFAASRRTAALRRGRSVWNNHHRKWLCYSPGVRFAFSSSVEAMCLSCGIAFGMHSGSMWKPYASVWRMHLECIRFAYALVFFSSFYHTPRICDGLLLGMMGFKPAQTLGFTRDKKGHFFT